MTLEQLCWADWAAAAAAAPAPLRPGWMTAELGRVGREYEIVRAGGARACVVLVDPDERRVGYTVSDVVAGTRLRVPGAGSGPTAFVGALGARLPAVVWEPGPAASDDLAELLTRIEDWARDHGAGGVTVGSVPHAAGWNLLADALTGAGYLPVRQPPEAVLRIDSSGLAGVLDRLSHSQRKNVRRQRAAFADSGGYVLVEEARSAGTPEHVRLLCEHYRKFGHLTTPAETADRLRRAAALPGAVLLTVADRHRLRGLSVFAVDPVRRELFGRLSACRRDGAFSYFNLVFYARIDEAAGRGVRLLHYGDGSYAPKVQRGCELRGLTTFVRSFGGHGPDLAERCAARSRANLAAVRAELPPRYHPLLDECEDRRAE